ncbi:MAG: hypothetical protein ACI8PG_004233 [Planctomycetota bacterium]
MAERDGIERLTNARREQDERHDEVVASIDADTLRPIVRKIRARGSAVVSNWECHKIKGGIGGGHLLRVNGGSRYGEDTHYWSVVLKILRRGASRDQSQFGWRREVLAYQSGILDDLPGGMEAATCYQIDEKSDSEAWMWFEDLGGDPDAPWTTERYGLAARHLGQFNGHYLNEPSLPSHRWQRDAMDRELEIPSSTAEKFLRMKDHPMIAIIYPSQMHDLIVHLFKKRNAYMERLFEQVPQTFGHMDAFRGNLFSRDHPDGMPSTGLLSGQGQLEKKPSC